MAQPRDVSSLLVDAAALTRRVFKCGAPPHPLTTASAPAHVVWLRTPPRPA